MPTEFAVTDDLRLGQIHDVRLPIVPHRRQMVPPGMPAPVIVPVLGHVKNVVQVLLADHAERVQDLVLERLDHPLDESLQVRRPRRRLLDLAAGRSEDIIE